MLTINCAECGAISKISMNQSLYEGPFRCWKCHKLFLITIRDDNLESCTLLTQEELQRRPDLQDLLKQQP